MPESAANIFSMTPPVSLKNGDSVGAKSTFSGDSNAKNSSSFSSKLSHAEDRQRSGLAESDVADKKVSSGKKKSTTSDVDEKGDRGSEQSNAVPTKLAARDNTDNSATAKDPIAGDSKNSGLAKSDVLSEDVTTSETRVAVTDKRALADIGMKGDHGPVVSVREGVLPTTADEISTAQTEEPVLTDKLLNGKNQQELTADDFTNTDNSGEDVKTLAAEIPATDESTVLNADFKGATETDSTLPIVGVATGLNTAESAKAASVSSESSLLLTPGKSAVAPGTLAQSASASTLASRASGLTPPVSSADASENVVALPTVDKRLGRLASTIEVSVTDPASTAVALGQTKNSSKVDASVMSLRNQALGLDGGQALNQSTQPMASTLANGERAKGILVSDLTQTKDASLSLIDSKVTLASAGIRTAAPPPPTDGVQRAGELSPMQIVTQLNQSAGQSEPNANAAMMANNEGAKGLLTTTALDHMLAASTSGIVTAPTPGRVDLAPSLQAPLQAPLNVPLLASSASEVLSGNVRWMVSEGVQNATVSVTPAGMGPITVQIGVEKEQMSISIVATQASTREALEATLPRLREQLGTQGLESVRVDISDGRSDQSKNNSGFDRQAMGGSGANSQEAGAENSNNEGSSASLGNNNELDSGERVLSDTERDLLSRLQNLSTDPSIAQSTIKHGYDLYV